MRLNGSRQRLEPWRAVNRERALLRHAYLGARCRRHVAVSGRFPTTLKPGTVMPQSWLRRRRLGDPSTPDDNPKTDDRAWRAQ